MNIIKRILNKYKKSKWAYSDKVKNSVIKISNEMYFSDLNKGPMFENTVKILDLIDDNGDKINVVCYKYIHFFETIEGMTKDNLLEDENVRKEINDVLVYIVKDIENYLEKTKVETNLKYSESLLMFRQEKNMIMELEKMDKAKLSTFNMITEEAYKK